MVIDLGVIFSTLSITEPLLRAWSWLRGRRLELRCMPVIDWTRECEDSQYGNKGRQIWDPKKNPGGPSRTDLPIVQLDLRWPNKKGQRSVHLTLLALQEGFIQGCIVRSPENPNYYRAFVCLTYKGRRAWDRYCTERRMRRRSRIFSMEVLGSARYDISRRRDPRTNWSLYPPESGWRVVSREQADVTYGCVTPDLKAKMEEEG